MSVAVRLEVRDFTPHPDRAERAFEDIARDAREGRHRDGARRLGAGDVALRVGKVEPPLLRRTHDGCRLAASCAARSVLFSSMVMVIGPTPPGTGVMSDATSRADAKSTSPARR